MYQDVLTLLRPMARMVLTEYDQDPLLCFCRSYRIRWRFLRFKLAPWIMLIGSATQCAFRPGNINVYTAFLSLVRYSSSSE